MHLEGNEMEKYTAKSTNEEPSQLQDLANPTECKNINDIGRGLFNKITPTKTFIILAFIFGVLFSAIIPPFQAPDEPAHFYRAYQLSGLKIVGEKIEENSGGYIPKQIVEMTDDLIGGIPAHKENKIATAKIAKYINMKLDLKDIEFTNFKNTVLYSPILYLPQTLGITISNALNFPPLWMVYLGRILNLITFILIVYSAIKITPICKWGFALLGLMPMSLALASSLSADTMGISLSFLLISLILNYALSENKKINGKKVLLLCLLSFLLGLCKLVYIFIPFLFLLIPIKKFSSNKKYFASFFTIISCTFIGAVVWYLLVQNLYSPMLEHIKPHAQMQYMLIHPQCFIKVFLGSFANFFTFHSFVGNLGWLDNSLPTIIVAAYFIVLILCGLTDNNKKISINLTQKVTAVIVLFMSILFVDMSMYIFWNKVGNSIIEGLQGRYFIPMSPLFLIFLYNKNAGKISIINVGGGIFLTLFSLFVLTFTTWMIINRYYTIL